MVTAVYVNHVDILPQATLFALRSEDTGTQLLLETAFAHLGPLLGQAVVKNISGTAARSELDKLCEPLKKLVANHVRAKGWIEQALLDPAFPAQHIAERDRAIFLRKIIRYRDLNPQRNTRLTIIRP